MKADKEAMKEHMATMMEAMMSIKKIMEANVVAIAATSVVAKVNPMPPSDESSNLRYGGQRFGKYGQPHDVQIQNEHAFPPYGTPPNENVNNSTPILIESQQPQSNHAHVSQPMGETHGMPHHNLADFEPCLRYATKG